MKIYRNHYGSQLDPDESTGYSFHSSRRDAELASKDRTPHANASSSFVELMSVPPRKASLLCWLNKYAGHPNNG